MSRNILRMKLRTARSVVGSGSVSAVFAAFRDSESAVPFPETSECLGIHWIVTFGL